MHGSLSRSLLLAVAAILGGGYSVSSLAHQPAMISVAPRPVQAVKHIRSGAAYSAGAYGRKGAGVSMAAQQRASRKARNVARNRRSHG